MVVEVRITRAGQTSPSEIISSGNYSPPPEGVRSSSEVSVSEQVPVVIAPLTTPQGEIQAAYIPIEEQNRFKNAEINTLNVNGNELPVRFATIERNKDTGEIIPPEEAIAIGTLSLSEQLPEQSKQNIQTNENNQITTTISKNIIPPSISPSLFTSSEKVTAVGIGGKNEKGENIFLPSETFQEKILKEQQQPLPKPIIEFIGGLSLASPISYGASLLGQGIQLIQPISKSELENVQNQTVLYSKFVSAPVAEDLAVFRNRFREIGKETIAGYAQIGKGIINKDLYSIGALTGIVASSLIPITPKIIKSTARFGAKLEEIGIGRLEAPLKKSDIFKGKIEVFGGQTLQKINIFKKSPNIIGYAEEKTAGFDISQIGKSRQTLQSRKIIVSESEKGLEITSNIGETLTTKLSAPSSGFKRVSELSPISETESLGIEARSLKRGENFIRTDVTGGEIIPALATREASAIRTIPKFTINITKFNKTGNQTGKIYTEPKIIESPFEKLYNQRTNEFIRIGKNKVTFMEKNILPPLKTSARIAKKLSKGKIGTEYESLGTYRFIKPLEKSKFEVFKGLEKGAKENLKVFKNLKDRLAPETNLNKKIFKFEIEQAGIKFPEDISTSLKTIIRPQFEQKVIRRVPIYEEEYLRIPNSFAGIKLGLSNTISFSHLMTKTFPISLGKIGSIGKSKTNLISQFKQKNQPRLNIASKIIQNNLPKYKQTPRLNTTPKLILTPKSMLTPALRITPKFILTTIPNIPKINGFINPSFSLKLGKAKIKSKKIKIGGFPKFRYTPSVAAIGLKIKAFKIPKTSKSGLAIRPLIQKRRRGR